MIPLQLQLKNFLSYGPTIQTIDFASHHLICLAGKNGHGKSALIDAMTWAIWGSARKTSGATKADDGILRLGQTHMMVIFEFICNNTAYRVRREYIRGSGRGETRLYFGVYDTNEERFRSLTETTTKETQRVIQEVVGLDYEAFIHSVCIRQGQSNAFSRKSPKERKEILARILGLEQYERYKKQAQEQLRKLDTSIEQTHAWCQQLEEDIAQKSHLQEQQTACEQSHQTLTQEEQTLRSQDQQLENTDATYAWQETELNTLRQQHQQLQTYYAEQHKQLTSLIATWRATFRELRTVEQQDIQAAYEQQQAYVQDLRSRQNAYYDAYEQVQNAQQKAHERKHELYQQFLTESQNAQQEAQRLYTQLQELDTKLQHKHEQRASYEHRYHELLQEFTSRKQDTNTPAPSRDEAQTEFENAVYRTGRIDGMDRMLHAQEDRNSSSRRHRTRERISQLKPYLQQRISDARAQLAYAHQYASEQQQRTATATLQEYLYENLFHLLSLSAECKKLAIEYETIQATYQRWSTHTQQYQSNAAFEQRLQDNTYQYWCNIIATWRQKMHENTVSKEGYEEAHNKLEQLRQQRERINAGSTAQVQQERRNHIRTLIQSLKKLKQEGIAIKQRIATYPDLATKRKEIQKQRSDIAQQLDTIQRKKEQIIQQKGALTQQLDTIAQKEKTYREKQTTLEEYRHERTEYAHIAQAFSRDGIQALLIENAIPEIEQEANALLRELTDNQSQLIIESLRDLKSGKTKETLDIKISDNMGIRSYELFSGGEAFRIDFAIRVAISTLLARRAGTQLQTLIIDEGFGSQDEEGLHNIMDAIHRIQNHFAKIIVVSHLPELKDQFPAQFVVHKGPHGSSVHVHAQG